MPNSLTSLRPLLEEEEGRGSALASAAAPRPVTLAAQEAINPVPKLLLSFPVPRMVSQMHLETAWPGVDDELAGAGDVNGTTAPQAWTTEELDDVVRGVQESAHALLLSGSYTQFFQEQLHHEIAPSPPTASSDTPHSAALSHVRAGAAAGLRGLLASMGQQGAVLDGAPLRSRNSEPPLKTSAAAAGGASFLSSRQRVPLTHIPNSESWTRREGVPSMRLRPRAPLAAAAAVSPSVVGGAWATTSSESLDSTGGGSGGGGGGGIVGAVAGSARRSGATAATAGAPSSAMAGSYEPRTGVSASALGSLSVTAAHTGDNAAPFAEWVSRHVTSPTADVAVAQLLQAIAALPLQLQPFKGIEADLLVSFLSSLLTKAEETRTSGGDALPSAARGLLCCQCLAHPHFPSQCVPEGMVSRVLHFFACLVRDLATVLQDSEQRHTGAARDEKLPTTAGRRSAAGGGGGGGGGDALLPPLLELLRAFLGAFAAVLCNPTVRLVSDTDVLRLEELCHHCLFRLTRSCAKDVHTLYCSYVMDSAVQLYRCVWNCLAVQRQSAAEHFVQQLPVCEALTQRTYQTHVDGRAVLPLTVAMLAAAQSTPLPTDGGVAAAAAAAAAEALQWQCGQWANTFVHEFLLNSSGDRERAEETLAWSIGIRVAEDLVDLLGMPEWPGADLLLRSLVMGLAQFTLGSEAVAATAAETLRPLAVDVLGHVAVRLFDARRFPVASAIVAEMERLGESASTNHAAARLALGHVMSAFPSLSAEDRVVWERLCGAAAGAEEEETSVETGAAAEPDHHLLDLIAAVYMADSRLITNPSTAIDYASSWYHVRAARVMTWVGLQDTACSPAWVPLASLDALLRWKSPSGEGGQATNWSDVCAWTQAISTQAPRSMLSLHTRHLLVSLLFSVFHLKDAHGASVAVSDVVQKKTLAHLTRLTTAHPPLHRYLWPIVRQCVRDDSARVRESIVPLLLSLLSDAAEAETSTDAAQMTAFTPEGIAAEVISSLLHLLGDKSVSVVSRTITALDTFLTDPGYHYLLATPQGASLLSFIQQKLLLLLASPTTEAKHRTEVVKHFVHRWVVTLADSDDSLTGAHAQLARELVTLTTMGAPDFPYDVVPEHPLVQLLQGMQAYVVAHDPAAEAVRQSTGTSAAAAAAGGGGAAAHYPRRRPRGLHVDAAQLLHVMRCAAQSVWMRYQCFHSSADAVACLATVRVLTLARTEWVVPLAEVFAQSLAYPPPTTSPLAGAPEALGGTLLQLCQVLQSILHTPKLPLLSLDYLARCFTALLSKYVGPYQQRVIIASCGALCALISCGAKHRLSTQVNVPYLRLCYSLMNTYYCRVRTLLPTLASQPQSVAYTQRFLFLLSEFLRMYPGWRQQPPHPALLDDAALSSTHTGGAAGTPNQLAKGLGITANTYQLLEEVLHSCGDSRTRERVAVIALRVVASLCMLDPTTYFYRAEDQIRAALTSADASLQLQGLSLLSDFLKEEDERVDAAARTATRLDTTALILGARGSASASHSRSRSREAEGEVRRAKRAAKPGKPTAKSTAAKGERRPKQARSEDGDKAPLPTHTIATSASAAAAGQLTSAAAAAGASEDFNSGMSTWIFQKFHDDIARLASSSASVPVRSLCLRLFQQAAQGGLLPPHKYVRTLVALAADVHAPLRQQAAASLAALCDRHEDVVAAAVGRGVLLAFDLHHACHAHLLRSAIVALVMSIDRMSPNNAGREVSVHGGLYSLLHKRSRDNMITTLVRVFYQDGKVGHWCDGHAEQLAVWAAPLTAAAAVSAAGPAGVFGVAHPLLLLCHLTVVLFTLPFQHESDVMHLVQQCRVALDLVGQSALDWLRETQGEAAADTRLLLVGGGEAQWKAMGSLLLAYLRRAIVTQYRLTTTKVLRYRARESRGSHSAAAAPLRRREAADGEGGTSSSSSTLLLLLRWLQTLVEKMQPALVAPLGKAGSAARAAAWHYVSTELEAALMAATAEDEGRGSAAASLATGRGRKATIGSGGKRSTTRTAAAAVAAKRKRARSQSSEGASLDSTEESEEEETLTPSSTAARSASSLLSSVTSSASSSQAEASVEEADDDQEEEEE